MDDITILNLLGDVDDVAVPFGMSPGLAAHFARVPLGMETAGLTYFRFGPRFRTPFGHRHGDQEEVYLVLSGSVRVAVEQDVHELAPWDVIRVAPHLLRCIEGGPEGGEVLAFGAPADGNPDGEQHPGWWPEEPSPESPAGG
ncbi:MAG: hypothetical protein RIB67_11790 [Miltoncostaeaceae bacterium]